MNKIEPEKKFSDKEKIYVDHYSPKIKRTFKDGWVESWNPTNNPDDKAFFEKLFTYACNTSYDAKKTKDGGHTRESRGGSHEARVKGEVFFDIFTGKLGEWAVYKYFIAQDESIQEPNITDPKGYGNSDSFDIEWNNKNISVKTTTKMGNLLLLQKEQYNTDGDYIPNLLKDITPSNFDYHVLCKYDVSGEPDFNCYKKNILSDKEKESLKSLLFNSCWKISISGFISNDEFVNTVIKENYIIPGSTPGNETCFGTNYSSRTEVDVDNYYVQAGDLHYIVEINNIQCPKCGAKLIEKSKHSTFFACPKFPNCMHTVSTKNVAR